MSLGTCDAAHRRGCTAVGILSCQGRDLINDAVHMNNSRVRAHVRNWTSAWEHHAFESAQGFIHVMFSL